MSNDQDENCPCFMFKEFDHFQDHKSVIESDADSLLGNVLTALKGQKWKSM